MNFGDVVSGDGVSVVAGDQCGTKIVNEFLCLDPSSPPWDVGAEVYYAIKGARNYAPFAAAPGGDWDFDTRGVETVDHIRRKLMKKRGIDRPIQLTVEGTLFPAAPLAPGWWDLDDPAKLPSPRWRDGLQKWLFYGFDLWGPSWDFAWGSTEAEVDGRSVYIGQIADGDESDSLPVVLPPEAVRSISDDLLEGWGGLQVQVTGLLGHRSQFTDDLERLSVVGGTLDYCMWLNPCDENHRVEPICEEPEIYSGYLWRCVAPQEFIGAGRPLMLNDTFFIWEHTNHMSRDAVDYSLQSLAEKESYIEARYGKLLLLQKSTGVVPGEPIWPTERFYRMLGGKRA